jgi:hypothetical protein
VFVHKIVPNATKIITIKNKKMMKRKILFSIMLFCIMMIAVQCASVKTTTHNCPLYYTGNDEPAASGMFVYAEDN